MVMKHFPEVGAILHPLALLHGRERIRDELPPILTEVCCAVGPQVPVTRYGLTGTPDFGEACSR